MRTLCSGRVRRATLIALSGVVAACDLPTSAPIFQQTWVVPGDSIAVPVTQILPSNVALNGPGTAFLVTMPAPAVFNSTLGDLCGQPVCQSPGSVNAPIPAFTSNGGDLTRTVTFPVTVASATVTAGTLTLQIDNSLGFDPLRPNGASAPYGSISIAITNGAATSTTTLNGATRTIADGASTSIDVPVPTGTYATSFSVAVLFDVPAGGNANLAASNAISITPSVTGLTVSQVAVVVQNEPINTTPSEYDLEDVDFADEVQSGGLILDIANPFTATATLDLVLHAPAQDGQPEVNITKPINIPATPTSSVTVDLTGTELRSLVGKSGVEMTVSGDADGTGAGNTVSVSPTQRIVLRTNMRLVINMGG